MDNILSILKSRPIFIPQLLINNYIKLNLNEKELLIIIYFLNNDNSLNPKQISEYFNWKLADVLETVSSLSDKNLLTIKLKKHGNVRAEQIILDGLYQKLAFMVMDNKETNNKTIFDQFETEFGRTLSPIEYELVNSWLEDNSEEVILKALKEAVYNGVSNFRYIDKILHDWKKKGIKSNSKNKKESISDNFDYDWLNE